MKDKRKKKRNLEELIEQVLEKKRKEREAN
jgi:hypothetical protein